MDLAPRLEKFQSPEGAWSSTATEKVSREALVEAGAIAEEKEQLTRTQRVLWWAKRVVPRTACGSAVLEKKLPRARPQNGDRFNVDELMAADALATAAHHSACGWSTVSPLAQTES